MRYIAELERKVQTLQTEATSLSAQLSLLQVMTFLPVIFKTNRVLLTVLPCHIPIEKLMGGLSFTHHC